MTIGIRNLPLKMNINFECIVDNNFNEEKLINVLKSYNFIINKKNKNFIVKYKNDKILNINVNNNKWLISFDHRYLIMGSVFKIINNYLKNDITKKNIYEHKTFYSNDLLILNIFYTNFLKINNKNMYKHEQFTINKDYLINIQKQEKDYLSKIDIIISIITNKYFKKYKKNNCNILLSKSDKNNDLYLGNPLTFHSIKINNKNNISKQVRNSYKLNRVCLFEDIDIFITSWIPNENYNNQIKEINPEINPEINSTYDPLLKSNFNIILSVKNNYYVVNLFYL